MPQGDNHNQKSSHSRTQVYPTHILSWWIEIFIYKTPCNHSKLYCTFCPDPACKSHRSKYCRNKPDNFSPRPAGDPDGKCSEDDQKSNNSEGEKDTQLDSHTATPQI